MHPCCHLHTTKRTTKTIPLVHSDRENFLTVNNQDNFFKHCSHTRQHSHRQTENVLLHWLCFWSFEHLVTSGKMAVLIDFLCDELATGDAELAFDLLPGHEILNEGIFSDSGTIVSSDESSSNWSDYGTHEQTFWPTIEESNLIKSSTEQKFDGFSVLGKSWNIVKNCTISRKFPWPIRRRFILTIRGLLVSTDTQTTVLGWTKVVRQTKLFMKGMPELSNKKFIWEIELTKLDNSVLSLVLAADTENCSVAG